jgi:hypothetical protein
VLIHDQNINEVLPPPQHDANVLWPELVTPYVKDDKIPVCPSDQSGVTNSYALDQMTFVDMTDFLPNLPPMPALAAFQVPSNTVMLGETGTGDDFKTPSDKFFCMAPDNADACKIGP